MPNARTFGKKESRSNSGKNKDKNGYKGQITLTPKVMEKYQKKNQYFFCGEQGHNYCDHPKKKNLKDNP